jgi:hypothetical protein
VLCVTGSTCLCEHLFLLIKWNTGLERDNHKLSRRL